MNADELALRRTEWALERTQLAWVRTGFTLMTTGLAFDKGSKALFEAKLLLSRDWSDSGHVLGIGLACVATVLLLWTTVGFLQRARELGSAPRAFLPILSISLLVAMVGFCVAFFLLIWG